MSDAPIICLGEVLWDCLPRGLFLGGAPLNVAIHLKQLGRPALPASAVGQDFLGDEVARRIADWNIDTSLLAQDPTRQTGVVLVTLTDGQPSYEIVANVAWDAIPDSDQLRSAVAAAPALVFGTLAAREPANRQLINELIDVAQGKTFFDMNLRPPFDDLELVWQWAKRVDILKLNELELQQLLSDESDDFEALNRTLHERCGCPCICMTAGARGAGMLTDGHWFWTDAQPITVRDTVGAGDSFSARLIDGLLTGDDPSDVLARAARLAEFVASSDGATPAHPH